MSIKNLIKALFLLLVSRSQAQQFSKEVEFLNHLEEINQYKEAVYYVDQIFPIYQRTTQLDSLHFLKARYYYLQKDIHASIRSFGNVSMQSKNLWEISRIYMAFQSSYDQHVEESDHLWNTTGFVSPVRKELKVFEMASNSLLRRDFAGFDSLSNSFTYNYYELADYERDMQKLAETLKSKKKKSPFVAGLLSALVPGGGRFYQGKIGQGSVGLLSTALFGLQAYEAFRKDGVGSARFVIFGGIFSAFYVANIWGSVVSVRVNEVRFNHDVNETILINMHLPIRLLFD